MTPATFRADFTAFADTTAYPDAAVTFWLTVGAKLLNVERWDDLLDTGLELFTAHNLALERGANRTAATGGAPGMASGVLASKAVDKVQASYDTTAGLELNAGHWNLTLYGSRFINLARMVGSGGMQL